DVPPVRANPLLLPPNLPRGVYFVVTRRPSGGNLRTQPGTPKTTYEILHDAPGQEADIEQFLRLAAEDQPIKDILMRARPAIDTERFVAALKEKSQGNFMYVSYVLADIAARQPSTGPLNMDALPLGLPEYYEQFWSDMQQVKAEGWADWKALYRPVIE